jgi:hypothetical protein
VTDTSRKIKEAMSASGEELWTFVKDRNPEVLNNATLNRNLTEDMAVHIAKKRSCPAEALGFLAQDVRFKGSYKLKLAICRNPKTPVRVSLSLLKFLRIFDLGDLTRNQYIPVALRQKIEQLIIEKIKSMPSGIRISLSRRASSTVVEKLMERSGKDVILACLESPVMTEGLVFEAMSRANAKPLLVKTVAGHQKWSLRYRIRFGLIRNFNTPLHLATEFIKGMKLQDLRFLYEDARTPKSTKPFIYREIMDRGDSPEEAEEEVYDLDEEDGLPEEYQAGDYQDDSRDIEDDEGLPEEYQAGENQPE